MARFNEILAGRFNRAIQKLLSMKGGPPAAQLASEVTTNIQFNQMGVDFRYLEGWERFGNTTALAAGGAGTQTHIRLRNPAGSNVVIILEKIQVLITTGASSFVVRYTVQDPGDLGGAGASDQLLDARAGGNSKGSILKTTVETSAAPSLIGTPIAVITTITTQPFELILDQDQQVPLLPGSAIDFINNTAVQDLRVNNWFRERFLEDSERT